MHPCLFMPFPSARIPATSQLWHKTVPPLSPYSPPRAPPNSFRPWPATRQVPHPPTCLLPSGLLTQAGVPRRQGWGRYTPLEDLRRRVFLSMWGTSQSAGWWERRGGSLPYSSLSHPPPVPVPVYLFDCQWEFPPQGRHTHQNFYIHLYAENKYLFYTDFKDIEFDHKCSFECDPLETLFLCSAPHTPPKKNS